jgi:hypothetical protein
MKQHPHTLHPRGFDSRLPVPQHSVHATSLLRLAVATGILGFAAAGHAATINTNNAAAITAFQAGATIETFDAGLTGLVITAYTPVAVPAGSQFFSRNLSDPNVPSFNSGGASFNNPVSNPGTPVGVFNPEGGIAADVVSQTNVIGPMGLDIGQGPGLGLLPGAFMEVRFVNPVSTVGFQVTFGSLQLILKDVTNTNLLAPDASVNGTAGNFIGISRATADIGGATILSTATGASFTLDNFTFARGNNTTTTVPDSGSALLSVALAGAFLGVIRRMLLRRRV